MKVFLCHSSFDKPLVREVARAFPRGISTWLDEREIHTGQDISAAITAGVRASGFLVVFLSDTSLASKWVQRELRIAIEKEEQTKDLLILPVLVQPITAKLPKFLATRNYATLPGRSEREVKDLGKRIAEDVCYWTCRYDAFCQALRTHSRAATAMAARSCPEAALIVDTVIPTILKVFEAVFEKSILGRRKESHPPVWLIHCAHAVAHHILHQSPENALLGKEFAQQIHQAFFIGYFCAQLRRRIFSIPLSSATIDGAVLSGIVDTVISEIRQGTLPIGAVQANDAAQSILATVAIDTFEGEAAGPALGEAAWLGGVYAVGEERISNQSRG
jgi:hypothetical protein